MDFQDFIKSRPATWLLSAVLLLVLFMFGRVYMQKNKIDKEIAKLQEQAQRVQKENDDLAYLIQYFNTPAYQEKQAREKFNLKKEGEHVVSLPEDSEAMEASASQNIKSGNPEKWFNYFFGLN